MVGYKGAKHKTLALDAVAFIFEGVSPCIHILLREPEIQSYCTFHVLCNLLSYPLALANQLFKFVHIKELDRNTVICMELDFTDHSSHHIACELFSAVIPVDQALPVFFPEADTCCF